MKMLENDYDVYVAAGYGAFAAISNIGGDIHVVIVFEQRRRPSRVCFSSST